MTIDSDYYDSQGNPQSLEWMISNEPEWAASRIRVLAEVIKEREALEVNNRSLQVRQDALLAVLGFAREHMDTLEAHAVRLHDFLEGAPIGSGVCMCGDDIATHPSATVCGHKPIDQVRYYADLLIEEAPATSLAKLKAQWQAELLEEYRERLGYSGVTFVDSLTDELRRQADGDNK